MTLRIFSLEDNRAFAVASGDRNPIHVDPRAARRSPFGAPVVHGVHAVLWALEQGLPARTRLVRLKAQFPTPLRVGDDARVEVTTRSPGLWTLRVSTAGRVTAEIEAEADPVAVVIDMAAWPDALDPEPCRPMSLEALRDDAGALDLARPAAPGALAPEQAAFLLGLTRLVGMRAPGLYSLFSAFDIRFSAHARPAPRLRYGVVKADPRYARLVIAVDSDVAAGEVVAFSRPAPQEQPGAALLAPLVADQPFAGRRALVIGGSRGLGEVSAKLLAMGGADVRLSYHVGADDAAAVVRDIRAAGGAASDFRYDAVDPLTDLPADPDWRPTDLCYFATGSIGLNDVGQFDAALFARYGAIYVEGFSRAVRAALKQAQGPLRVLYPATEYLDSPNTRAIEYAAAKAAGETVGDQLAAAFPGLVVHHPRLPRLPTDQTLSFSAPVSARPELVLLEALRALHRAV